MERIQRKRTKGWRMPENTKYVGRPTKFGNPFRLEKNGWIEYYSIASNKWETWSLTGGFELNDIIELYELWITGKFTNTKTLAPVPDILELRGKNLACFCNLSHECHVDVLLELCSH